MNRTRILLILLPLFLVACKSTIPERSGFLSSYEALYKVNKTTLETVNPESLSNYGSFIVDPVELRLDQKSNTTSIKAKMLADRLHDAVVKAVANADRPGQVQRSARIRLALTRIRQSSPLLNIHPGTKLTGAGLGEAAIEAEIVDATTGDQLWAYAAVQKGNRMELDAFDTYDDAEDAIDFFVGVILEALQPDHHARASATR